MEYEGILPRIIHPGRYARASREDLSGFRVQVSVFSINPRILITQRAPCTYIVEYRVSIQEFRQVSPP